MADKNLTVNVKSKFDESGFKKLNQNIDKTQANLKETSKGVSGLSSALAGGLAGAFATLSASLIPFAINSVKAGAALQNLRAGFEGTAKDMELLRKATANTVSEANLIALSNQATDLGLTLEDQAKLFSLAEDAGDKYGGSLEENFQKIVLATDGSAKGLRAVGVSATEFKKKVEDLVKVQGVKLDQMTAEEQLQLRLKAIFELTGTTLDSINKKTVDAADVLEQLGLVAETAAGSFGNSLVQAFIGAGEGARNFNVDLESVSSTFDMLGRSIGFAADDVVDFFENAYNKAQQFRNDALDLIKGSAWEKFARGTDGNTMEDLAKQILEDTNWTIFDEEFLPGTQKGRMEFERRQEARERSSTSKGSTQNKTTEKAKELLTSIDEIQKKITEKQELQLLYQNKNQTNTQAYLTLLEEVVALETQLATLRGGANVLGEAANVPRLPIGEVSFVSTTGIEEALQAERDKAIEDGKVIYGSISNILNTLGVATDNFVGTLISGFNSVLAIMEAIKAVNSILNVIPFLATGGIMQNSGLAMVGERGPELVALPAGARVYNNQDTQRYLNSINSQPQSVSVYINANLDGLKFLENNMPKYFDKRNFKRIN